MGIHDELISTLCQEDEQGNIPIVKIVGTLNIDIRFEVSMYLPVRGRPQFTAPLPPRGITPDIIVTKKDDPENQIVIEVKGDIKFDAGQTLRQIKKYSEKFDTRLIIPWEQERFVPYFKNEGFQVYLWKAKRKWICDNCDHITYEIKRIRPRCSKCGKTQPLRLAGLVEMELNEALSSLQKPLRYHRTREG